MSVLPAPFAAAPQRAAVLVSLAKLLLHVLTLGGYGYFRDELYYIACSEHLAFGYVDHPPVSIALLKLWRLVFGDSLAALHLLPGLVGALVVYVAARIALALGG